MYRPRAGARLCNEQNGTCLIENSNGSVRTSGELAILLSYTACLNTGYDTCAHPRGFCCLLSFFFAVLLFCRLALWLSVFLTSNCEWIIVSYFFVCSQNDCRWPTFTWSSSQAASLEEAFRLQVTFSTKHPSSCITKRWQAMPIPGEPNTGSQDGVKLLHR